MPKQLRWLWVVVALVAAALGTFGCGLILGLDQYKEGDASTNPEGGEGGGGCNVDITKTCIPQGCPLTTEVDFLNACTTAECVTFDDNARVKGPRLADGGLPPVPPVDSGITDGSVAPQDGAAPVVCNKINANPVVYVAGTAKPYIAALARSLFTDTSSPITIVWRGMSSCNAWEQLIAGEPFWQEPGAPTGTYWSDSNPDGYPCVIPTGGDAGVAYADITVTDLFAQTCGQFPNGLPNNIGDFYGPVQTMTFVVPKASSERAISATGAYYVYGFGADSGTAPWTDPSAIFRLADESGTQRLIAAGIGVKSEDWKGTNMDSTNKLLPKITAPTPGTEGKTIGPLAYTNITDAVRPQLEILAFKHYGQSRCAYFPDSTDQAKDKVNVRDGHYAIWGPIHFATHVQNSVPTSPTAQKVINMWIGATPPPQGLDLIQIAAINNLVPTCAMQVRRRTEMGPLEAAQNDNLCGCYFEKAAGQTSKCQACQKPQDCPTSAPKCNYGYCEAR